MIRRDYVLRMIEECIRALARIAAFKENQQWQQSAEVLDGELQRLFGADARELARLPEADLLGPLMQSGPTHALRERTLVLTALLKEAGDVAAAENRAEEAQASHLRALNLLLSVLAQGEIYEAPEFVPKVEVVLSSLDATTLPVRTLTMLMQHYERSGQFAKAEDALFALLEAQPGNTDIVDFGTAFYERLARLSDSALAAGDLPRAELHEGLRELQRGRPRQSD